MEIGKNKVRMLFSNPDVLSWCEGRCHHLGMSLVSYPIQIRKSPSLAWLRSIIMVLYKHNLLGECISLLEISAFGLKMQFLEHFPGMYETLA